jgi:hypothetical protein
LAEIHPWADDTNATRLPREPVEGLDGEAESDPGERFRGRAL